jgi:hypothetical protein
LGRILNNEIHTKFKIGKHLSCEFKVNRGLKQGDAIVPLLFNVVLETAVRILTVETQRVICDKYSQIMA